MCLSKNYWYEVMIQFLFAQVVEILWRKERKKDVKYTKAIATTMGQERFRMHWSKSLTPSYKVFSSKLLLVIAFLFLRQHNNASSRAPFTVTQQMLASYPPSINFSAFLILKLKSVLKPPTKNNQSKKQKTYNSEDSLVVTHLTTNSPACG